MTMGWNRATREQEVEWVRQNNLAYGALIVAGVYMVQPFLTASALDVTARICVIAFAVAIPLLAALILLGQQEAFRRRTARSPLVAVAKSVGQMGAFVGLVAAFWHIQWVAGVVFLGAGLVGTGVHSAGYWRLERTTAPRPT
jgi:type III secretory pathway component EscT